MFSYVHHVAYTVEDMDKSINIFSEIFELELIERRVVEGDRTFEMATFKCGQTLIELQRPIDYPELSQYLKDNGPGLNHIAFAVPNLSEKIEKLKAKGIYMKEPGSFVAGTGWTIANFDTEKSGLALFQSRYHDDHLTQANDSGI